MEKKAPNQLRTVRTCFYRERVLEDVSGLAERWRMREWMDTSGGEDKTCQSTEARWAVAHFCN